MKERRGSEGLRRRSKREKEDNDMTKSMVVYWSQTGNTEAMANAVAEGLRETCPECELKAVSEVTPEELKDLAGFALGCPAMGDEVLEETEMQPFVDAVVQFVGGKNVALFGSYGWGDGQWMRDWQASFEAAGASIVNGEGLICNDMPDDDMLEQCRDLGRNLGLK